LNGAYLSLEEAAKALVFRPSAAGKLALAIGFRVVDSESDELISNDSDPIDSASIPKSAC